MHIKIQEIIDSINNKSLYVPAFQREYVWTRKNAKELFDSLIKEYHTGTLLTWKTTKPPELKGIKYDQIKGEIKLVLDGQQRITTLYMVMTGQIPYYYEEKDILEDVRGLYVNLETLELEYYKPTQMDSNPMWVALTKIYTKSTKLSDAHKAARQTNSYTDEQLDKIVENFGIVENVTMRGFAEQVIPATANVRTAIDIFYKVNDSGVNLTEAELALAQICGYWEEARAVFKKRLESLEKEGFDFGLDFIVHVLLAVLYKLAPSAQSLKKLHDESNSEAIKVAWERLDKKIFNYVINTILKSYAHVDSLSEIGSNYPLIPIIAYVYDKGEDSLNDQEIRKIVKWFYYAKIRQRYINVGNLARDLHVIATQEENPFDVLLSEIEKERSLTIRAEEFIGVKTAHPLFSLMKWHFKSKGAKCLGTGAPIRSRNSGDAYRLENDHIFPFSLLKEKGYNKNSKHKYDLAQEITNMALLASTENKRKSAKPTDIYLSEIKQRFPDALKLQCIPDDERLWQIENYEEFLKIRRDMLASELNNFLQNITETNIIDYQVSIDELIEQGENSLLEFKSTLRWDVREKNINKKLEEVILKSIAAFHNADGGTLVIGVADDGQITGLDDDYATLKEGSRDSFELHLRNLVMQAYGTGYAAGNNFSVSFQKIIDKDVCIIEIKSGLRPLYTPVNDKNGQKIERFYVRSGNSSVELTPSEAENYIRERYYKVAA